MTLRLDSRCSDNLNIVVAALSEDAVLKRFSRMGENILFLSENPEYDPIMVSEDQIHIMGVAFGLLKRK